MQFSKTLFFTPVLCLQPNREDGTGISQILSVTPLSEPPPSPGSTSILSPEGALTHHNLEFTLGPTLSIVHSLSLDKWIMTYIHHYNIIQSIFTAVKLPCVPIHALLPSTHSNPRQPLIFYIFFIILPFQNAVELESSSRYSFQIGFSLSNMHSSFLHVFS